MHVQIEFNGQQYRLELKILNVLNIWKILFSNASKIYFDTETLQFCNYTKIYLDNVKTYMFWIDHAYFSFIFQSSNM